MQEQRHVCVYTRVGVDGKPVKVTEVAYYEIKAWGARHVPTRTLKGVRGLRTRWVYTHMPAPPVREPYVAASRLKASR